MSTFYMPLRGAPGSPVFDPDNVRSLYGFFDDLEYWFNAAGIQDETAKKQHATCYAPDSEKTIWRTFPEFADSGSDFDAFKHAIIKDYIGGSLFSIHDLTSLVETTAKTSISSIKAFSEYSRQFRDIASSLASSGYLRDHERDQLFLQGIEDSLRQAVLQRLHVTQPFVLFPRHQYTIEQVTTAAHHILDSAIPPASTTILQSELCEATQAIAAAKAVFVQIQQHQQQFPVQPISLVSPVPTPVFSTHLSAAYSRPPVPATTHNDFVPRFDYEERLTQMRQQLAALEQQRAALRAASYAIPSEEHHTRTTDDSGAQILEDRQAAPTPPQPVPHENRHIPVPVTAPPPSRFKLPVVYFSTTPATPASTIEPVAAPSSSPTSSNVSPERPSASVGYASPFPLPGRSSRPSTTAKLVPLPVYRHPASNPTPLSAFSIPRKFIPSSPSFVPMQCPVYHHSPLIPSPPPSHLSSTPFSPRPVSPPSNAPTPTSQASHPVAAHPCSLLHSTSILNILSPPSPPSPRSPAPPSSSTTPSDSDYSANAISETSSSAKPLPPSSPTTPSDSNYSVNAISETSSPVKPLPLSCPSARRPSPTFHNYIQFPLSVSPSLTVQLSGNRSRRLDTFDFLFSFIRPPSRFFHSGPHHAVSPVLAQHHIGLPHRLSTIWPKRDSTLAYGHHPRTSHSAFLAAHRRHHRIAPTAVIARRCTLQLHSSPLTPAPAHHPPSPHIQCCRRQVSPPRLANLFIPVDSAPTHLLSRRQRHWKQATALHIHQTTCDASYNDHPRASIQVRRSRCLHHAPCPASNATFSTRLSPPARRIPPALRASMPRPRACPHFPLRTFSRPPRVRRAHVPLAQTRNHAVPPLPPLTRDEFGPRTVQI